MQTFEEPDTNCLLRDGSAAPSVVALDDTCVRLSDGRAVDGPEALGRAVDGPEALGRAVDGPEALALGRAVDGPEALVLHQVVASITDNAAITNWKFVQCVKVRKTSVMAQIAFPEDGHCCS